MNVLSARVYLVYNTETGSKPSSLFEVNTVSWPRKKLSLVKRLVASLVRHVVSLAGSLSVCFTLRCTVIHVD